MKLFGGLDRFLLASRLGKTLFGPMVFTGAAVLLGISFEHQPLDVHQVHLNLLLFVLSVTWYRGRRSELERAASEARSTDLGDRLRDLILATRNQSVAAAERAEEAAVRALRSSLCGLEAQAASADLAAGATTRAYLALLEREGLTASLAEPEDGGSDA